MAYFKLEKPDNTKFSLPCVVDCIWYEKQVVVDVILHKDQMIKKDDELSYMGVDMIVNRILKNTTVKTEYNLTGGYLKTDTKYFRKVRYYCIKQNNENGK